MTKMMFANQLLGVTILAAVLGLMYHNWPDSSYIVQTTDAFYDYIIVGGGTAGCVLANRLSEDPDNKVLLLEAGADDKKFDGLSIPFTSSIHYQRTSIDWSYTTVPQQHACASFEGQQMNWARGKVLGGSSTLNYLVNIRGNPADYDNWAADGCTGWSYDQVLPYFIKSERNTNSKLAKMKYHGNAGPQIVSDMRATKLPNVFLSAGQELGYDIVDANSGQQLGVSYVQGTTNMGKRWGTVKAYLRPVMSRKNLHVMTEAHVHKILIRNGYAVGVQYTHNDTLYTVKARQEVILSAGTVGSAQILLLSGVGPKWHLDQMQIPVVADLPVGENLQDHIWPFGVEYFIKDQLAITEDQAKSIWSLLDYLIFGMGFLTTSGIEGVGFFRSEHQPENISYPYIQLHMMTALVGTVTNKEKFESMMKKSNIGTKVFRALFGDAGNKHGIMMLPILLHPKSRGRIRLSSTDPLQHPHIDPRYLEHPDDLNILLEAVRLSQKLVATESFQLIGAKSTGKLHPNCKDSGYDTDDYWRCFIKHNTMTMFHPVGTCKMGPLTDPTTVVDPRLRVHGVKKLRVVDASVMPTITSGNINAPVRMIAEKAVDFILGTRSRKEKKRRMRPNDEL